MSQAHQLSLIVEQTHCPATGRECAREHGDGQCRHYLSVTDECVLRLADGRPELRAVGSPYHMTLESIGRRLGVTGESVRQTEERSILKIKRFAKQGNRNAQALLEHWEIEW